MRKVKLPGGEDVPALGLGTWFMGESESRFEHEVGAVRYAMECGIRLIDTAEMYANGGAEEVVGAAIKGFDAICKGEYDHLPEAAFYMVGTIEEAIEKAEKMAKDAAA